MAGTGFVKVTQALGFYDDDGAQVTLAAGELLPAGHPYAKRFRDHVVPAEESDLTRWPMPARKAKVEQATAAPGETKDAPARTRKAAK